MRQFTIHDKDTKATDSYINIKKVLDIVPDLENVEIEKIIDLESGQSLEFGNIVIIRNQDN